MKKIFTIFAALALLVSCNKYEFNYEFNPPTEVFGPSGNIDLDVTSSSTVKLSWSGGGAADGGYLSYEVVFDKEDGDFSAPIDTVLSDNKGMDKELNLTHARLNIIARKAGIRPEQHGKIKWAVITSRGGESKKLVSESLIEVTRGEGIDNFPKTLYLKGTGLGTVETEDRAFGSCEEGVYVIYTSLAAGTMYFESDAETDAKYYYSSKLKEGEGSQDVTATKEGDAARVTVDFNTLNVKIDIISEIKLVWAAENPHSYAGATVKYVGNGNFEAIGARCDEYFRGWDWCANIGEERHSFYVKVNDVASTWGRPDNGDAESRAIVTDGVTESRVLDEFEGRSQWAHLWKAPANCDKASFDIKFTTGTDGRIYYTFSNFGPLENGAVDPDPEPEPEPDPDDPDVMFAKGAGCEKADGIALKDLGNGKYQMPVTSFNGGAVYFKKGTDIWYANGTTLVKEDDKTKTISATTANQAERLTIDVTNLTVTREAITDMHMAFEWTRKNTDDDPVFGTFSYNGNGTFTANVENCKFPDGGDSRYVIFFKRGGTKYLWSSETSVNIPAIESGGSTASMELVETDNVNQWGYNIFYKLPSECSKASFDVTITVTAAGAISHVISNFTPYTPPQVDPDDKMYAKGAGCESDGIELVALGNGKYQMPVTSFNGGVVYFQKDSDIYYVDTDGTTLVKGDDKTKTISATTANQAERLTIDVTNLTVTREAITDMKLWWAMTNEVFTNGTFTYAGNGAFTATGVVCDAFKPASWGKDERYSVYLKIGGSSYTWGNVTGGSGETRPTMNADNKSTQPLALEEYEGQSQWGNLYKLANAIEGTTFDLTINVTAAGVITHTFSNITAIQ